MKNGFVFFYYFFWCSVTCGMRKPDIQSKLIDKFTITFRHDTDDTIKQVKQQTIFYCSAAVNPGRVVCSLLSNGRLPYL